MFYDLPCAYNFQLDMSLAAQKVKILNRKVDSTRYSAAASGWAGWALAPLEFQSSINPLTTRGADYAHRITASPPGFENPAASLLLHFK